MKETNVAALNITVKTYDIRAIVEDCQKEWKKRQRVEWMSPQGMLNVIWCGWKLSSRLKPNRKQKEIRTTIWLECMQSIFIPILCRRNQSQHQQMFSFFLQNLIRYDLICSNWNRLERLMRSSHSDEVSSSKPHSTWRYFSLLLSLLFMFSFRLGSKQLQSSEIFIIK